MITITIGDHWDIGIGMMMRIEDGSFCVCVIDRNLVTRPQDPRLVDLSLSWPSGGLFSTSVIGQRERERERAETGDNIPTLA